jgi:hypothetical protein
MTPSLALSAALPSRTSLAAVSHDLKDPLAAPECGAEFWMALPARAS